MYPSGFPRGYVPSAVVARRRVPVTKLPKVTLPAIKLACAMAQDLTVRMLPNGGAHIAGPLPELELLRRALWAIYRYDARLLLDKRVNDVSEPGYPMIEVHPSIAART